MSIYSLHFKERDKNNTGKNDPNEFLKLSPEDQERLLNWISLNTTRRNQYNYAFNSYSLKHLLPNNLYVNNGAFKGAMLVAGYRVLDKDKLNWIFNVYVRKKRRRVRT